MGVRVALGDWPREGALMDHCRPAEFDLSRADMLRRVRRIGEDIRAFRRHLHMYPELGGHEVDTSDLVAQRLHRMGLEVTQGLGGHGVLGLLRGDGPGPTVALRADMDALPMSDAKDVSYRSRRPGVMHACGHDAHTAILVGVARLLSNMRAEGCALAGNVKFIFQPDEEGNGGALPMRDAGVLANPAVDAVYALHVNPSLPTGTVSTRAGVVVGFNDEIVIDIDGVAGHGSQPHGAVDAIVVAGQVIGALQGLVSRETSPSEPVAVSLGKICGGYRNTIIAPRVSIEGTAMCVAEKTRTVLRDRIERLVDGVAASMRATGTVHYKAGYPAVKNDAGLVDRVRRVAQQHLGPGAFSPLDAPSIGGEDFSYFSESVPGCFIGLGVANPESETPAPPVHHPQFDIDERALEVGMMLLAGVVLNHVVCSDSPASR